ncbi:hypothetical protein ACVW19_003547 [Streptomyces sp. TE5632]
MCRQSSTIRPARSPTHQHRATGPRRRHTKRHPFVAVLLIACSAVVTGAKSFTAIGGRATKAPQDVLARLGARTTAAPAVRTPPSSATIHRVIKDTCPGGLAVLLEHDPAGPDIRASTAFNDTPKAAVTSSQSRPATNAATARSHRASCADGDRCRASPTRSLPPVQRPGTRTVSDQTAETGCTRRGSCWTNTSPRSGSRRSKLWTTGTRPRPSTTAKHSISSTGCPAPTCGGGATPASSPETSGIRFARPVPSAPTRTRHDPQLRGITGQRLRARNTILLKWPGRARPI